MTIYMRLASGSPNINMDNVMISVTTTDNSNYLSLDQASRATPDANVSYGFAKTLDVQELRCHGSSDRATWPR